MSEAADFHSWLSTHAFGRAHAKTARALRDMGCESNDRDLRTLREQAIAEGLLICADDSGYFVPATADEVGATVGRALSQAVKMIRSARRTERLARARFGPESLPLFDWPIFPPTDAIGLDLASGQDKSCTL